jgi:hypothetical protein
MNILEALMAECEPYTIETRLLKKALIDYGLDENGEYSASLSKNLAAVAAKVLSQFLVLGSESESGFSQNFDTDKLKKRIEILCIQADVDASMYISTPTINTVNVW